MKRKHLRASVPYDRQNQGLWSVKVWEWLGLHDRRSAGLFLVAIGCAIAFVSVALVREGATRGHLLALAGMACWGCGMSIGRRWKYLTKTPAQITADVHRRRSPRTFTGAAAP